MKYSILHRNKDGKQERLIFEARNREHLFSILASQGINAIKIESAVSATREHTFLKKKSVYSTFLKYFTLSIIIAVLAITVLFMKQRQSYAETPPLDKYEKSFSSESLDKAKDSVHKYKVNAKLDKTKNCTSDTSLVVTNNLEKNVILGPKNKSFRIVSPNKGEEQLFHTVSDMYISRLVNSKPGNAMIGTMNYDKFKEQFIKSLSMPIVINENDSEEDIMKKQAVIDTRAELKQMLDNGQDIAQIMREAESEMRRLWQYRRSLHLELRDAFRNGNFSHENMQNYIDAANKMLKENGLETLKHPQFWIRRLQIEEIERKGL